MLRRFCCLGLIPVFIIIFCVSCGDPVLYPSSTSVGGAVVETGHEIDEQNGKRTIKSKETTFAVNEDFYFSFFNNQPFGENTVIVELINCENDEVVSKNRYKVDPEWEHVADMIWFGKPGMYRISVKVGDQVRATQEVIIE